MDNFSNRFEFSVCQCGCVASRILNDGKKGRVSAVFDNSFYFETEEGIACIGNGGLDASPLNLNTTAPTGTNWHASGLRLNDKVNISADTIWVGERFSFLLADAAAWTPNPVPATWGIEKLKKGLTTFREACVGCIPLEGLGRFIESETRSFKGQIVCKFAEIPIKGLCDWLTSSFREPDRRIKQDPRWVQSLIGMGPGLTPSGDDFIGGMMIALQGLGELEVCHQLWTSSQAYAFEVDNPIALAHLEAASEGMGSAAVHSALAAIMAGRPEIIRSALVGIDKIGHTSGWDAMAGVVKTFDAWLKAHDLEL